MTEEPFYMIPPSSKDMIRHFILNLLTVLKVELDELESKKNKRGKIKDLINTASLVIANEDLFLGKNPDFFIQQLSLNEIIDLNLKIFENEIAENNT